MNWNPYFRLWSCSLSHAHRQVRCTSTNVMISSWNDNFSFLFTGKQPHFMQTGKWITQLPACLLLVFTSSWISHKVTVCVYVCVCVLNELTLLLVRVSHTSIWVIHTLFTCQHCTVLQKNAKAQKAATEDLTSFCYWQYKLLFTVYMRSCSATVSKFLNRVYCLIFLFKLGT